MSSGTGSPQALLGIGEVRHTRLRPVRHAFRYRTYFLCLPMRAMRAHAHAAAGVARNRWAPMSFHDRDHGTGGPDALAWAEGLLAAEGVHDADGEIWLQTYPRVLGYVFKPVSFWYCHRADGTLAAVLVEVNNTFGERHCYLLHGGSLGWGRPARAAKVFHVSPFCRVEGSYRFAFMRTGSPDASEQRIVARIDHDDATGPLLQTSLSGRLQPAHAAALRRAFWAMPAMTFGIVARIHWQALRLWARRVPFVRKPAAPGDLVTHGAQTHLPVAPHPTIRRPSA